MDEYIYIGKITGAFGIKGELKILSDFERKDLIYEKGFDLYFNKEKVKVSSYRKHKNFDLVTINDIYDINEIYKYVKQNVYIKRKDLNLKENEYLLQDLIGFIVYDKEKILGKVKNITYNNNCKYLFINGETCFYIPLIDIYIKKIDLKNKQIITNNGGALYEYK